MSSTPRALLPTSPTSLRVQYATTNASDFLAELTARHQKVSGYLPANDGAKAAFQGADIIVIPAGIPREKLPP